MNYVAAGRQPFLVLVDDDQHSANVLTRMLLAHGAPSVRRINGAEAAADELDGPLADPAGHLPGMVIVSLRSAEETRDLVARLTAAERASELLVVALTAMTAREVRDGLIRAGAAAVFERRHYVDDWRREAASLVSFWVRNQHLSAIGT